jgi:restriction endonuclease S subunit
MNEWKTYKLSEIAQMIGGGTPKTTVEEYWNGDIPWLSATLSAQMQKANDLDEAIKLNLAKIGYEV